MSPTLIKTKKRAAGALFAVALNQVQIHQTRPVGSAIASDSFSNDRRLWLHDSSALLRPIFRYLEIDSAHWPDLETTATSSHVKNHVGSVCYFTLMYIAIAIARYVAYSSRLDIRVVAIDSDNFFCFL
ncbi:hypothetical protein HanOQP8_Chr15g0578181 [Helianthus annuus]|nr:hypothetical protein HanOQP8_Chr15g0578181 [Helianthus annuus]